MMTITYPAEYVGYSGTSVAGAYEFFENFAKSNNMTPKELQQEIEEAEQMSHKYLDIL